MINPKFSKEICNSVGIDISKRVNEISDADIMSIREYIDKNKMVEG